MWSKIWCQNRTPKSPETQESRWENWDFPSPKSDFFCTKFDFLQLLPDFQEIRENLLQRLSDFFNGIPISSTAFQFLQRLSKNPRNLFSTAFRFLLYCQNTHILNILTFRSKLCNSCVIIFRHWVFCQVLIAIHHTVLKVFKTCMLKWAFN